jgi:hypothetical protein
MLLVARKIKMGIPDEAETVKFQTSSSRRGAENAEGFESFSGLKNR